METYYGDEDQHAVEKADSIAAAIQNAVNNWNSQEDIYILTIKSAREEAMDLEVQKANARKEVMGLESRLANARKEVMDLDGRCKRIEQKIDEIKDDWKTKKERFNAWYNDFGVPFLKRWENGEKFSLKELQNRERNLYSSGIINDTRNRNNQDLTKQIEEGNTNNYYEELSASKNDY